MQAGDLVVVFFGGDNPMAQTVLTPAGYVDSQFGRFAHKEFIGRPFGSKVSVRHRGAAVRGAAAPPPNRPTVPPRT